MKVEGMVYLVGAGPGDKGLMTLRGVELLSRADVVVYDALVNPELLRWAPKEAEVIYAGKRAKAHAIPQDQLNDLLAAKAREGKCVVRLKGGDPYIFGRGGEEAEQFMAANIPVEVVPGISSIVAAPNYAGIPLTHRDHCSSFTVITGHEDPSKEESRLQWEHIAKTPGTKVILMGVDRIQQIARELVAYGMDANTPAAMVRWGTTGYQQTLEGTLSTLGDRAQETGFKAPAVTVIGDVVRLRHKLNWFESRPLFGQRIVVTRTRQQASQLTHQLQELGAAVLEIPTIKVAPPQKTEPLQEAMSSLNSYDWIIFTSPNGVTAFFNHFFAKFDDLRDLGGLRIGAVGPATAAKVREHRLHVDLVPEEYLTNTIVEAFEKEFGSIENLRILLMRAEVANPDLPRALELKGGIVDDIACYRTVPETEDTNGAAADLTANGADWITFTSSSTVENFHQRFDLPDLIARFPSTKIITIGPETTKALTGLSLEPAVEANPYTIAGVVDGIRKAVGKKVP
jgi:uroporphyrinogen III methyltransferase/synthase